MKLNCISISSFSFLLLFSLIPCFNIFPQIIIKEKISITPQIKSNSKPEAGCSFGNCYYDLCDSSELFISFEPSSVQPAKSTIIKLWVDENFNYQYNEDDFDLVVKTISAQPDCGSFTYLGEGQYLFTAPDTLTVDSLSVTINYENYSQHCAGIIDGRLFSYNVAKTTEDCPDCFPYWNTLIHNYASAQITIRWDSLYVEIFPDEIFSGDTADVIIKKRLPDGSLVDFDSFQTFEIATLEGCTLGNILLDDSFK